VHPVGSATHVPSLHCIPAVQSASDWQPAAVATVTVIEALAWLNISYAVAVIVWLRSASVAAVVNSYGAVVSVPAAVHPCLSSMLVNVTATIVAARWMRRRTP